MWPTLEFVRELNRRVRRPRPTFTPVFRGKVGRDVPARREPKYGYDKKLEALAMTAMRFAQPFLRRAGKTDPQINRTKMLPMIVLDTKSRRDSPIVAGGAAERNNRNSLDHSKGALKGRQK